MRVVIIGAGGHASEVLGALEARNDPAVEIVGLAADGEVDMRRFAGRGVRHIGSALELGSLGATHFIAAAGYPAPRRALTERALKAGLEPFTVIHPEAWFPHFATAGSGAQVLARACIGVGAIVGSYAVVGAMAVIGHDCRIGAFASVMPGAAVSGDTVLGEGCLVGTGSAVIEKRQIGAWATVGAGAVVTRDVPGGVTAVGIPARW